MDYVWDESKRISNLEKHEINFRSVYSFDWNPAEFYPSPRYGEIRTIAIGYIAGRLHCVIFTDRREQRRIISIRKANHREMRKYDQAQT